MPGNFGNIPKAVLDSWPKPNYVNPKGRFWLPTLACTLLGFGTVLVAGRIYLRARKHAGILGLDDLFILIGWLVSIGFSTAAVIDSEWYSISVHTWDVPLDEYVGAALTGWIAQILFLVSTCATKTSVLLFYRRMAKDTYSRKWLYATWLALGFTAAYFVGVLLAYCLMCQPLNAYWLSYDYHYDKPYKCINGNFLSPFVGVLSVVSDIYAVLLPCIWLHRYNLHVTRRQRIGLDVIFALGTIVAGCGIARTYYLWRIKHTYDTSWTGFDLFMWSLLELHLAIIFACAPSLRAFVRRYLVDTFSMFRSKDQSYDTSRTMESSQNISTLQSNDQAADVELGKSESTVEQRILTKPSRDTVDGQSEEWSTRSYSSDQVPHIRTADDYEVYVLQQLNRYGPRQTFVASERSEDITPPARSHLLNQRDQFDDEKGMAL